VITTLPKTFVTYNTISVHQKLVTKKRIPKVVII